MSKTDINSDLVKKFASLIYKEVPVYIVKHQNQYEDWLKKNQA